MAQTREIEKVIRDVSARAELEFLRQENVTRDLRMRNLKKLHQVESKVRSEIMLTKICKTWTCLSQKKNSRSIKKL